MTITINDQAVEFTTGVMGDVYIQSIDGVELEDIDFDTIKEVKAELESEIRNAYMDMIEDEDQKTNYYLGRN